MQRKHIPLRVHLRPSHRSEANGHTSTTTSPASTACDSQRAQQVKELLRLSNLMRADIGLNEVLQKIAASTSACTGFGILVICLLEEGYTYTCPVGFAG